MSTRNRFAIAAGAALILLFAGVGWSASFWAAGPATALAGDSCILACYDHFSGGAACDDYYHTAPREGDFALYGDGWHDGCVEGNCNCSEMGAGGYVEAKHEWCPPSVNCSGGGGSNFIQALAAGDGEGIADGLDHYAHAVRVVPERGAVQLIGCTKELIAHILVSAETLDLVAEHFAE